MTAPLHTDALLATIQERVGASVVDLLTLFAKVRERLAKLATDPARLQGPELDAIVDHVLAEMAVAARRTVRAGSNGDLVQPVLAEKQERVTAMASLLTTTTRPTLAKALLVVTAAEALVSGLSAVVSGELVRAQTDTARRRARTRDVVLMWVPERDACARCLRYAGVRLLRPTDQFPGGLSFDPAQQDSGADPIPGPPLHPHCRCELQTVRKGDSEGASEALQREAERAILKGWALESEGNASRERAAKALLASGKALVPVSVRREAAKRLGAGERFTRGVPSGNETPAEKAFLRSYSGVYR